MAYFIYYSGIRSRRLKKSTKNLRQDSRQLNRYSKSVPPEYKSGMSGSEYEAGVRFEGNYSGVRHRDIMTIMSASTFTDNRR